MKTSFFSFLFLIIGFTSFAQTTLTGNSAFYNLPADTAKQPIRTVVHPDPLSREITAIEQVLSFDSARVVVLSATGLANAESGSGLANKRCIIAFKGCDEDHGLLSYFNMIFYEEYSKNRDQQKAFFIAVERFYKKHPESTIIPVMTCQ